MPSVEPLHRRRRTLTPSTDLDAAGYAAAFRCEDDGRLMASVDDDDVPLLPPLRGVTIKPAAADAELDMLPLVDDGQRNSEVRTTVSSLSRGQAKTTSASFEPSKFVVTVQHWK